MRPANRSKVFFFLNDVTLNLTHRKNLRRFIEDSIVKEGMKVESVSYIFCTDSFLLKLNRQFLKHNSYTDIITFNMPEKKDLIKADVFISVDRVRENAKRIGVTITSELHRVIFHGALHLCGYRDKTQSEKKVMRKLEDEWLSRYFS